MDIMIDTPFVFAVNANECYHSKVLPIGDNLGELQLIQATANIKGFYYIWPGTDAMCNLTPMPFPDNNMLFEPFQTSSIAGSRDSARPKELWRDLCQLCGGEQMLLNMDLTRHRFLHIIR